MLKTIALAFTLLAGCSFGSANLQSKHSSDLEARRIRRIAVLPPETSTAVAQPPSQQSDAPEMLAKQIYSAMASLPHWQIVAETEVQQVEHLGHVGLAHQRGIRLVQEVVQQDRFAKIEQRAAHQ